MKPNFVAHTSEDLDALIDAHLDSKTAYRDICKDVAEEFNARLDVSMDWVKQRIIFKARRQHYWATNLAAVLRLDF